MRTYANAKFQGKFAVSVNRTLCRATFCGLTALVALLATAPMTGCGGGKGGNSSAPAVTRKTGDVTLTVIWPERTRLIPDAANSIVVTLRRTGGDETVNPVPNRSQTLTRPAGGGAVTSTATFTGIELGTYEVTAVAYPGDNGPTLPSPTPPPDVNNGVPLARTLTAGTLTVNEGENAVTVAMETTVTRLETVIDTTTIQGENLPLVPDDSTVDVDDDTIPVLYAQRGTELPTGQTFTFNVIPRDADGNRVLISPARVTFEAVDPTIATVSTPAGTPDVIDYTVQAVTPAANQFQSRATFRVRYQEGAGATAANVFTDYSVLVSRSGTAIVSATASPVNVQWASFRGNIQNTGKALFGTNLSNNDPTNLDEAVTKAGQWPYVTGSQIGFSTPAIADDGTVYIGTITKDTGATSGDRKLYAIAANGQLLWTYDFGGQMGDIEGSPTLGANGVIYFGDSNGRVYALRDEVSGTTRGPRLVWATPTQVEGPIRASVVLAPNGTLYVATDVTGNTTAPGSRLFALNSFTGQPIRNQAPGGSVNWVFREAGGGIVGTPVLSPDASLIYVTAYDGTVFAVRPNADAQGTPLRAWRVNLSAGNIIASPVYGVVGGRPTLFVATLTGRVSALDATNGAVQNNYEANAPILSTPALSTLAGTAYLYVATLDNTSGVFDHKIVGLNAVTLSQVWRTPVSDINDLDEDGDTTEPLFNRLGNTGGFTSSPTVTANGTMLYIGAGDGNVYGINVTPDLNGDGNVDAADEPLRIEWAYATPDVDIDFPNQLDSSPTIDRAGNIYIGGYDGSVYAISQGAGTP